MKTCWKWSKIVNFGTTDKVLTNVFIKWPKCILNVTHLDRNFIEIVVIRPINPERIVSVLKFSSKIHLNVDSFWRQFFFCLGIKFFAYHDFVCVKDQKQTYFYFSARVLYDNLSCPEICVLRLESLTNCDIILLPFSLDLIWNFCLVRKWTTSIFTSCISDSNFTQWPETFRVKRQIV